MPPETDREAPEPDESMNSMDEMIHATLTTPEEDLNGEYDPFRARIGEVAARYPDWLTARYEQATDELVDLIHRGRQAKSHAPESDSQGQAGGTALDLSARIQDAHRATLEEVLQDRLRDQAERLREANLARLRSMRQEWEHAILRAFQSGQAGDRIDDATGLAGLKETLLDHVNQIVEDLRLATEKIHRNTLQTWLNVVRI